ncbi:MAG: DUF2156 domain-containing protein [Planctomycetaceae bacterium]
MALRCRRSISPEDWRRVEQHAWTWGSAPESYDIAISDGSFLSSACGSVMVSVLPHRRYWHVPGGLLGPTELIRDAVAWLKRVAERRRVTLILYSVREQDVPAFVDAGFEVTKFGEEPVLDLGDITWRGKPFEWVRRQSNFCRRAGLEVVEIADQSEQHRLADDLLEILREDLAWRTYSRPLRLLEGEFDARALFRRRLFVARSIRTGRTEAFLACSPMQAGQSWGFESYRRRSGAPRGVMPFLFRETIDRLQAEGVRQVSLCLVPGRNIPQHSSPTARRLVQWTLSTWYKRLEFLFNARGQDYFKSRFRPRFQNRYICVTPTTTLRSMTSFLQVSGAVRPDLRNLARNLWKHSTAPSTVPRIKVSA